MTNVLVVDDMEQNRYLLQALLTGNGYEVMIAADGVEALEKARGNPPDVIVTDILMPRMDGYQLCREWKCDEVLKGIPFVFYTATYTDPKDQEFALSLGAERFLIKPQEPDAFIEVIKEVLAEGCDSSVPPAAKAELDDDGYFKGHNEALIRKLEDKLKQLQEAKVSLEREVAERARAEEALRRSEMELRVRSRIASAFVTVSDDQVYGEALPIVLEVLDSEIGAFGYINENGALALPSMTGDLWRVCQTDGEATVFPRETWGECLWGRAILEKTTICLNEPCGDVPEGHVPIHRMVASPIINQGEVIGLFLVANKKNDYDEQDIRLLESIGNAVAPILNARLQRDQQEKRRVFVEGQLRQAQKMEAIGQLAGGVAHDFNNALQAIMGHATFALDDASSGTKQHEDLLQVIKGAEHAASLTRQLLAFSRQQVLQRRDIDVNGLSAGLLKMIRRVIGEHIQLDFVPGHDLGTVHADMGQVEQVVLNLCINARDAMPRGGNLTVQTGCAEIDDVYCEAHPGAQPGSYTVIEISDTGVGMDEETQKQIFEPFFTTKEVGRGTGLGLATVYGIVKQHDGFVHVYSEVNRGTTFKVYLPVVARSAEETERPEREPIPGGTETILLAEDEEAIRALGARILEKAGYTILTTENGEDAVELFRGRADEIGLVMLDVVMPKMGGQAALEEIRDIRPDVRVLFSSGYSANAAGMQSALGGNVQLIQKPYEARALLQRVREMLDSPASD